MAKNDAVFNIAKQVVFDTVVDRASAQANIQGRDIHKFIKNYNSQMYSEMARTGMFLATATPGILLDNNPYGQQWAPLSEAYRTKKMMAGYPEEFYRRKGELAQALFARDSTRDFGKANVTVSTKGTGIDKTKYTVDGQGRARHIKGAANSMGGQFAPLAAFRTLTFTIQMRLFTGLKGNVTEGMVRKLYPYSIGKKLGVGEFGRSSGQGRNQLARPLLRPFLYWYTTANFRRKIHDEFKIKV